MKKVLFLMAAFAMMATTISAQFLFDPKASKKEVEKTRQSAVTPSYKKAGQITEIRDCCKKNEACCNPPQKCCDPIIIDAPQQAQPQQNCQQGQQNCEQNQQNCEQVQQNCSGEQNCVQQNCTEPQQQNCNEPCCNPQNQNQQNK